MVAGAPGDIHKRMPSERGAVQGDEGREDQAVVVAVVVKHVGLLDGRGSA